MNIIPMYLRPLLLMLLRKKIFMVSFFELREVLL